MDERERAIHLANMILDQPGRDPDDDASVLSRQLLRTREHLDAATKELSDLKEGRTVILPSTRAHAEAMSVVAEAILRQINEGN